MDGSPKVLPGHPSIFTHSTARLRVREQMFTGGRGQNVFGDPVGTEGGWEETQASVPSS